MSKLDKSDFVSIIKDNKNLIYKISCAYCTNPYYQKDLQQEILLQVWKSLKIFDGRVKISTWIYRVALNTAISYYRNECKQKKRKSNYDISAISIFDQEYNSEDDLKIKMLYKFIESLNALDKALILLYLDNKKYKEISEILGITETNVATKISRIKKFLKEQFINY